MPVKAVMAPEALTLKALAVPDVRVPAKSALPPLERVAFVEVNENVDEPVTVMAPVAVTPNVEPVVIPTAPAAELPILTAPVEVPVLMLVAKLLEALRLIAAPEIVAPNCPVKSCATVSAPEFVVVIPVRPIVIPVVLAVPTLIVPAVEVAVPTSIDMLPELLVAPVAVPYLIDSLLLLSLYV